MNIQVDMSGFNMNSPTVQMMLANNPPSQFNINAELNNQQSSYGYGNQSYPNNVYGNQQFGGYGGYPQQDTFQATWNPMNAMESPFVSQNAASQYGMQMYTQQQPQNELMKDFQSNNPYPAYGNNVSVTAVYKNPNIKQKEVDEPQMNKGSVNITNYAKLGHTNPYAACGIPDSPGQIAQRQEREQLINQNHVRQQTQVYNPQTGMWDWRDVEQEQREMTPAEKAVAKLMKINGIVDNAFGNAYAQYGFNGGYYNPYLEAERRKQEQEAWVKDVQRELTVWKMMFKGNRAYMGNPCTMEEIDEEFKCYDPEEMMKKAQENKPEYDSYYDVPNYSQTETKFKVKVYLSDGRVIDPDKSGFYDNPYNKVGCMSFAQVQRMVATMLPYNIECARYVQYMNAVKAQHDSLVPPNSDLFEFFANAGKLKLLYMQEDAAKLTKNRLSEFTGTRFTNDLYDRMFREGKMSYMDYMRATNRMPYSSIAQNNDPPPTVQSMYGPKYENARATFLNTISNQPRSC